MNVSFFARAKTVFFSLFRRPFVSVSPFLSCLALAVRERTHVRNERSCMGWRRRRCSRNFVGNNQAPAASFSFAFGRPTTLTAVFGAEQQLYCIFRSLQQSARPEISNENFETNHHTNIKARSSDHFAGAAASLETERVCVGFREFFFFFAAVAVCCSFVALFSR